MTTPRITRADAAEHFATNVAGQHPPRAKALLDDIWGGKPQPAKRGQIYTVDTNVSMDAHEPIKEVVVPMGQRLGYTDLVRILAPGVSKQSRHKRRRKEAKKMVAIFKRIGTDNPPSAHEVMKMEAWKASGPSQLPRFERETRTGRYAGNKP